MHQLKDKFNVNMTTVLMRRRQEVQAQASAVGYASSHKESEGGGVAGFSGHLNVGKGVRPSRTACAGNVNYYEIELTGTCARSQSGVYGGDVSQSALVLTGIIPPK